MDRKVEFDEFGSFAIGFSIESSDIDVNLKINDVEKINQKISNLEEKTINKGENIIIDVFNSREDFNEFFKLLYLNIKNINEFSKTNKIDFIPNIYHKVTCINSASVPIIKLEVNLLQNLNENDIYFLNREFENYHYDKSEIYIVKIDISVNRFIQNNYYLDESKIISLCNKKNVEYVKYQLEKHQEILPIILILKRFMQLKNLNNTFTGGLSSYSLFLMILSFLKVVKMKFFLDNNHYFTKNNKSFKFDCSSIMLSDLLLDFLKFYGKEYDFTNIVINAGDSIKPFISKTDLENNLKQLNDFYEYLESSNLLGEYFDQHSLNNNKTEVNSFSISSFNQPQNILSLDSSEQSVFLPNNLEKIVTNSNINAINYNNWSKIQNESHVIIIDPLQFNNVSQSSYEIQQVKSFFSEIYDSLTSELKISLDNNTSVVQQLFNYYYCSSLNDGENINHFNFNSFNNLGGGNKNQLFNNQYYNFQNQNYNQYYQYFNNQNSFVKNNSNLIQNPYNIGIFNNFINNQKFSQIQMVNKLNKINQNVVVNPSLNKNINDQIVNFNNNNVNVSINQNLTNGITKKNIRENINIDTDNISCNSSIKNSGSVMNDQKDKDSNTNFGMQMHMNNNNLMTNHNSFPALNYNDKIINNMNPYLNMALFQNYLSMQNFHGGNSSFNSFNNNAPNQILNNNQLNNSNYINNINNTNNISSMNNNYKQSNQNKVINVNNKKQAFFNNYGNDIIINKNLFQQKNEDPISNNGIIKDINNTARDHYLKDNIINNDVFEFQKIKSNDTFDLSKNISNETISSNGFNSFNFAPKNSTHEESEHYENKLINNIVKKSNFKKNCNKAYVNNNIANTFENDKNNFTNINSSNIINNISNITKNNSNNSDFNSNLSTVNNDYVQNSNIQNNKVKKGLKDNITKIMNKKEDQNNINIMHNVNDEYKMLKRSKNNNNFLIDTKTFTRNSFEGLKNTLNLDYTAEENPKFTEKPNNGKIVIPPNEPKDIKELRVVQNNQIPTSQSNTKLVNNSDNNVVLNNNLIDYEASKGLINSNILIHNQTQNSTHMVNMTINNIQGSNINFILNNSNIVVNNISGGIPTNNFSTNIECNNNSPSYSSSLEFQNPNNNNNNIINSSLNQAIKSKPKNQDQNHKHGNLNNITTTNHENNNFIENSRLSNNILDQSYKRNMINGQKLNNDEEENFPPKVNLGDQFHIKNSKNDKANNKSKYYKDIDKKNLENKKINVENLETNHHIPETRINKKESGLSGIFKNQNHNNDIYNDSNFNINAKNYYPKEKKSSNYTNKSEIDSYGIEPSKGSHNKQYYQKSVYGNKYNNNHYRNSYKKQGYQKNNYYYDENYSKDIENPRNYEDLGDNYDDFYYEGYDEYNYYLDKTNDSYKKGK